MSTVARRREVVVRVNLPLRRKRRKKENQSHSNNVNTYVIVPSTWDIWGPEAEAETRDNGI